MEEVKPLRLVVVDLKSKTLDVEDRVMVLVQTIAWQQQHEYFVSHSGMVQQQGPAVQDAQRPVLAEYNARFDIRDLCQNDEHIPGLGQDGGVEVQ